MKIKEYLHLVSLSLLLFVGACSCSEKAEDHLDMESVQMIRRLVSEGQRVTGVTFSDLNCTIQLTDGETLSFDKSVTPVFSYDEHGCWTCNSQAVDMTGLEPYRFDGALPQIQPSKSFWTINGNQTEIPTVESHQGVSCLFVNRHSVSFIIHDGSSVRMILGPLFPMEDYFAEEVDRVAGRIRGIANLSDCLVLCEVADLHERTGSKKYVDRSDQTISNIAELCKTVSTDGVVFMGDSLWPDDKSLYPSQDVVNGIMENIASRLMKAHDRTYLMLGNHDGINGSVPTDMAACEFWFKYCDPYVEREPNCPWYYFDNERTKVRCIVLSAPDPRSDGWIWTYSTPQLQWLSEKALATEDGWNVLIFSHTHPYNVSGTTPLNSHQHLVGILNAYNRHATYEGGKVSADFSRYTNTRIAAMFVAHAHEDNVIERGDGYFTGYDLDFPTIVTDKCMTTGQDAKVGKSGGFSPERKVGTVTQDLWDVIVYNPKKQELDMVRFGAGEDRSFKL